MTFLEACWHWLSQSNNQKFHARIGAVVDAVLWQVYLQFSKKPKDTPSISASTGGIAAGGNISLNQRSLAVLEKALGPEHPHVAASLNDLAELYRAQGQYAKAEPLFQRSLAILEKALGPEHPNVANSLNDLAFLYYAQGQHAKAEPIYQRSLAILEKALGPEHPNVANSLNDLAELYRAQGQDAKAEPLLQRSLAIREKALGPELPDVPQSFNTNWFDRASMPPMLTALIDSVEQKKAQLDRARPLSAAVLARLQKHYDIELTDASNAIEGNALTLDETAVLIELGIAAFGNSCWDFFAFIDGRLDYDYEAVQWMRKLATLTAPIGESTVCELNRRIGACYQPASTGIYRQGPQWIKGSPVVFPDSAKIPHLMVEFEAWLKTAPPDPAFAIEAHFRLTDIHPFDDGNGRTARLLMNLLLIRGGYPPVAVGPDRYTYTKALERGELPFQIFMHERLDATLLEYLTAVQEARGESPACPR